MSNYFDKFFEGESSLKNDKCKHFLKLLDYCPEDILDLLQLAERLKSDKKKGREVQYLKGKNIVLIFEKDSTRTRCAFEVAAHDQGANVTYIGASGSQIGHKESMRDSARVLGRMYDAIEYRGYGQEIVEEFAQYSGVPVINGLTDDFHPTQILADLLTIKENCKKDLSQVKLCYMGDAHNNMCNSLMVGAAKLGIDFRICAPQSCFPNAQLEKLCRKIAASYGSKLTITEHLEEALPGCDFIYTDVWVSMGEPDNVWAERIETLKPYQVNKNVLLMTKNPEVKFLHCLPAFHNSETKMGKEIYRKFGLEALEVTDDVFESPGSLVFEQAENRLHTIKAILVYLLGRNV